jgi:hypothetical protein
MTPTTKKAWEKINASNSFFSRKWQVDAFANYQFIQKISDQWNDCTI